MVGFQRYFWCEGALTISTTLWNWSARISLWIQHERGLYKTSDTFWESSIFRWWLSCNSHLRLKTTLRWWLNVNCLLNQIVLEVNCFINWRKWREWSKLRQNFTFWRFWSDWTTFTRSKKIHILETSFTGTWNHKTCLLGLTVMSRSQISDFRNL
jgi:hypothetical protein